MQITENSDEKVRNRVSADSSVSESVGMSVSVISTAKNVVNKAANGLYAWVSVPV